MWIVDVSLCVVGVVAAAVVSAAASDDITCGLSLDNDCEENSLSFFQVSTRVAQGDDVPSTNQVLPHAGKSPTHPRGDSIAANGPDIWRQHRHHLGQVHQNIVESFGDVARVTQAPASSREDGIDRRSLGKLPQQSKSIAATFGEGARGTQASVFQRGESLDNQSSGKLPQQSTNLAATFGEGAQEAQTAASPRGDRLGSQPSARVLQESKSAAATFGDVALGPHASDSPRADGTGIPPSGEELQKSRQIEISERTMEFLVNSGPMMIIIMIPLFILVCLLVAGIEKVL